MDQCSIQDLLASWLAVPTIRIDAVEDNDGISIHLSSTTNSARCPQCQHVTTSVHDRFTRTLQHLPLFAHSVHLIPHFAVQKESR